jgi:3-dehydroquinate synthase
VALLRRANLPVEPPQTLTGTDFLRLMAVDKKVQKGRLRLVLLRNLGEGVIIDDIDPVLLQTTLNDSCLGSSR